jgi:hypothetical protein
MNCTRAFEDLPIRRRPIPYNYITSPTMRTGNLPSFSGNLLSFSGNLPSFSRAPHPLPELIRQQAVSATSPSPDRRLPYRNNSSSWQPLKNSTKFPDLPYGFFTPVTFHTIKLHPEPASYGSNRRLLSDFLDTTCSKTTRTIRPDIRPKSKFTKLSYDFNSDRTLRTESGVHRSL